MERVVRERMTTQDVEAITPQTLINIRPVVASIKNFFGASQLSQFMDQTNPLAGLTHKRRLSALGRAVCRVSAPAWRSATCASRCGRILPDRDARKAEHRPDRLAVGVRAGQPVRLHRDPVPPGRERHSHHADRLPDRRRGGLRFVVAQANSPLDANNRFAEERVLVRTKGGEVDYLVPENVDYMDVSPWQMTSVATAMIPFLEHDDANRALMGANMQRQAVPLLRSEAPLVGTGRAAGGGRRRRRRRGGRPVWSRTPPPTTSRSWPTTARGRPTGC